MKKRSGTEPRRIPQQRRARVTVDAIVQAAAHLLAARGWDASTTNHIAERAGVSIGSLYKYFPNKPSIVAEVARRRIRAEVSGIAATLEAHASDPGGMLAAMVAATAERYAASAALDTALMEQLGTIEMARFLRSAEASVVRLTASYLARHADQLRAGDSSTAFVAVHALRGSLMAAAAHNPRLLHAPAFRQELVRLLQGYLKC
jgi:AcrR family transcriptional regulator